MLIDNADGCADKCASADSWIKYLHLVLSVWKLGCIGKSLGKAKIFFQDVINRTDNEIDHGERCVIRSHLFTQSWIVFFKKIFVEVDNRISIYHIFLNKFFGISMLECFTKLVDDIA